MPTAGVLIVAEILPPERGGRLLNLSLEAIAAGLHLAQSLGMECSAAVLGVGNGESLSAAASELATHSLAKVYTLDHALLGVYTADAYTLALHQLIEKLQPAYVLFPHTYQVRDFAPALATRFGQDLISDVVAIRAATGAAPVFVRQLMQGKLNGDYRPTAAQEKPAPCFVSLQAGSFRADSLQSAPTPAPIEPFPVTLSASQIRTTPSAPFREAAHTVDLAAAPVIVSVGRGIREQDNIPLVQALADALGAELAASRPICDAGWLPMERQVGSSGQTVAPKLYLAVGISGAIQHLVGMKGAKTVIAINKDTDAPIFEVADYGVAADLFEIVPALTKAILAAKS
jgi:electron transfer flavoprotein alpha subunit